MEPLATHVAAIAKKLEEDEETGAQRYRYIKAGENHFSFAFTYAWMGASDNTGARAWLQYARWRRRQLWL